MPVDPSTPRARRRPLRALAARALRAPALGVACAMALWGLVELRLADLRPGVTSTLGEALRARLPWPSSPNPPRASRSFTAMVVFEPEPRVILPDEESWDEATRLLEQRWKPGGLGDDLRAGTIAIQDVRWGFWAPTTLQRTTTPESFHSNYGTYEEIRIKTQRALAVLRDHGVLPPDFPLDSHGGHTTTHVLWLGWVENLAVVGSALGLVASLYASVRGAVIGTVRARRRARDRRRWRRFRRGQCPVCRYSILGLEGDTCPECGHELPRLGPPLSPPPTAP